jgi:hypothetical protein
MLPAVLEKRIYIFYFYFYPLFLSKEIETFYINGNITVSLGLVNLFSGSRFGAVVEGLLDIL